MRFLDLTLPTPEENLALDEALLEEAERNGAPRETLRFWEPARPMVVLGRSSQIAVEVNEVACRERAIPVLRRTSGGATVLAGPGCLMYTLVLSYERRPGLRMIDVAHRHVMDALREALLPLVPGIEFKGTCDLVLDGKKVSGNAVRCRREHMLYHGTLLYDFPLELIETCLGAPPRQPDYRQGRPHGEFVTNLPASAAALRGAIVEVWDAREPVTSTPREIIEGLIAEKYSRPEWNAKY